MGAFRLFICVVGLGLFHNALSLITDSVTREVGPVQCLKDLTANTLTAKFYTRLNDDDINEVIGCDMSTVVGSLTSSSCDYVTCASNSFTITNPSTNAVERYLEFSSTVDMGTRTAVTNECGFRVVTNVNAETGYQWMIGLRHQSQFLHGVDRNYYWTCFENDALNQRLQIPIIINHNDLVVDQPIENPGVTMRVMKVIAGGAPQETSSCQVGEDLIIEIQMDIPSGYSDFLIPWGLYSESLMVSPYSNFQGSAVRSLTDSNGCPITNNVLELPSGGGFERQPTSTTQMAYYRTGTFQCKRYLRENSNELYFETLVNFCVGLYENDNRCEDYCLAQTGINGRRRRDVTGNNSVLNDVRVFTSITIEGFDDDEGNSEKQGALSSTTVAVVASVGAVVVIAMVVATIIVCVFARRRAYTGSDVDSRASSDRKLPVYA